MGFSALPSRFLVHSPTGVVGTTQVATYDEFEAIVDGAHLNPMKEDVTELEFKRSMWDSGSNTSAR